VQHAQGAAPVDAAAAVFGEQLIVMGAHPVIEAVFFGADAGERAADSVGPGHWVGHRCDRALPAN
jgi:hypothetical protein